MANQSQTAYSLINDALAHLQNANDPVALDNARRFLVQAKQALEGQPSGGHSMSQGGTSWPGGMYESWGFTNNID